MTADTMWVAIGLFGQAMFMMRFVVQWLYSEFHKRSVIPIAFWYFSICGGLILLAYSIYRRDPVFILGNSTGVAIYARNLYLIWREKRAGRSEPPSLAAG